MNATLQVRGGRVHSQTFICAQVDSRVSPASLTWLQVGLLRKDADTNEITTYQVWKCLFIVLSYREFTSKLPQVYKESIF